MNAFQHQNAIVSFVASTEAVKVFHQLVVKVTFEAVVAASTKIIDFFASINTDFDYEFRK